MELLRILIAPTWTHSHAQKAYNTRISEWRTVRMCDGCCAQCTPSKCKYVWLFGRLWCVHSTMMMGYTAVQQLNLLMLTTALPVDLVCVRAFFSGCCRCLLLDSPNVNVEIWIMNVIINGTRQLMEMRWANLHIQFCRSCNFVIASPKDTNHFQHLANKFIVLWSHLWIMMPNCIQLFEFNICHCSLQYKPNVINGIQQDWE